MNPIGIIDMHNPQQWGFIQFANTEVGKVGYPSSFRVEQLCWKIFYLQNLYRHKHHKYTSDLNSLNNLYSFSDKELKEAILVSKLNGASGISLFGDSEFDNKTIALLRSQK